MGAVVWVCVCRCEYVSVVNGGGVCVSVGRSNMWNVIAAWK